MIYFWFIASIALIQSSIASVPTSALTFETNVEILNANEIQLSKLRAAEELIKKIVATDEFKKAVLNHSFKGEKTFHDNGGLSNKEIYNKILLGAEDLNPSKNNTMDLIVSLYHESSSRTVGYTTKKSKKINMNTKYFDSYSPAQVSRNMMHEWLHKIGFEHAYVYSRSRNYSVPYGVGRIMEKLARKLLKAQNS